MDLPLAFKTFRTVRFHMDRELKGLSDEKLLAIPEGREDNILWNVGHSLCSIARLSYVFSGFDLPIPQSYLGLFGKNTTAVAWESNPDVKEVLDCFNAFPAKLEADYAAGKFVHYEPLELAPGHVIGSVEEAVSFHCFHEGLHIGVIITLLGMLEHSAGPASG